MSSKRVLNVGQCNYDNGNITQLLKRHFTVEVVPADSHSEAIQKINKEKFDLVLVNRVFDQTGESGLELIREMKPAGVPVMLVSNFPEAQEEAVASGAVPGFGKSSLGDPSTAEKLQHYLR